jgi:predicted neutral ceramidase superfamily lipid hydrolase
MAFFMANLSTPAFAAAMVITLFAGFVKGAVGFAMPMIMMGAFSSFLPPELALAGLILPTFVTNLTQAFRQGLQPALATMRSYWRMLVATVVFIVVSAAFVHVIPHDKSVKVSGTNACHTLKQASNFSSRSRPSAPSTGDWHSVPHACQRSQAPSRSSTRSSRRSSAPPRARLAQRGWQSVPRSWRRSA